MPARSIFDTRQNLQELFGTNVPDLYISNVLSELPRRKVLGCCGNNLHDVQGRIHDQCQWILPSLPSWHIPQLESRGLSELP
mmetsp:Transcript_708/g.1879  ORF Transcript_708/g.1879 Transcript_708/m.1879 type:complete len:82 (-) Transcript_708:1370-1615(-)